MIINFFCARLGKFFAMLGFVGLWILLFGTENRDLRPLSDMSVNDFVLFAVASFFMFFGMYVSVIAGSKKTTSASDWFHPEDDPWLSVANNAPPSDPPSPTAP